MQKVGQQKDSSRFLAWETTNVVARRGGDDLGLRHVLGALKKKDAVEHRDLELKGDIRARDIDLGIDGGRSLGNRCKKPE